MKSEWDEELAQRIMQVAENAVVTGDPNRDGTVLIYASAPNDFQCAHEKLANIVGTLVESGYLWADISDPRYVKLFGTTQAWIDRNTILSELHKLQCPR